MSSFTTYITYNTFRVHLPFNKDFAINPKRPSSARTAIAGNVIRQTSALHASSATATWEGLIPISDASMLESIRTLSATVTLWHLNKIYTAMAEIEIKPPTNQKQNVVINFGIVKEIQ